MKLIRDLGDLSEEARGGAVSIGNFDGVHRGHARIVERVRSMARDVGGPSVVFTFDPHPVRLLRPDAVPPPLTWTDRKAALLDELGIDVMVVYPTDQELLALSPQAFFDQIVRGHLDARAMVEGPNFFFGRDRAGNVDTLRQFCEARQLRFEVVEPLTAGDGFVSSSRVRQLIQDGDVAAAGEMLTQPYRIRGMVTHGAGRGAGIGFPTANIDAIDTLLPGQGVYAGRAILPEGAQPAAINIGPNPTFGENAVKVETHIIEFSGSLYGKPLEVDFLTRLRDIRPFASAEELTRQLRQDVAAALSASR